MDVGRALRRLDHVLVLLAFALIGVGATGIAVLPAEQSQAAPSPVSQLSANAPRLVESPGVKPKDLVIRSIGLRADVIPVEVTTEGVLDPPGDTNLVGWWKRSARAGATHGQTLLTGHSVSHGEGVMDHLPEVEIGANVVVRTRNSYVEYEVVRKVELNAEQVANRANNLFGQERANNRLVLVTCSDYRNGVWNKNTVVFAEPTAIVPR